MPKPQGTYLQTQKINKIVLRARQSKSAVAVQAAAQRRVLLRGLDIHSARNVAYLAHDQGTESTARGDVVRRALGELVDQLGEAKEKIDTMADTFAELREPHFEFRAVTSDHQVITAANVLSIAMATITLLMVLEKALSRSKDGR